MAAAAEAWMNGILEQAPRIAVFDCDGTLWQPDAGYEFMRWSQTEGLLSRQVSEWMDERYRAYLAGSVSEAAICGEMVQVYTGLREMELRAAAQRFFRMVVEPGIFPEMRSLVERLHAGGVEVWAVSSTNNWVIEGGVSLFGIAPRRVLAAQVRVVDGLVTDRLLAVPTDGAKADALRIAGVPLPDVAFGNSVHDQAMLEMSQHPCAVNPSEALALHARQCGWSVYWPEGCLDGAH